MCKGKDKLIRDEANQTDGLLSINEQGAELSLSICLLSIHTNQSELKLKCRRPTVAVPPTTSVLDQSIAVSTGMVIFLSQ